MSVFCDDSVAEATAVVSDAASADPSDVDADVDVDVAAVPHAVVNNAAIVMIAAALVLSARVFI